jgi:copper(I)-binding protein
MKHPGYLFSTLILALLFVGQALAQSPDQNAVVVEHPWARATPRGAKTGAVYVTLVNNGNVADRLLGVTTPVAEKVQFHSVSEENGVSRMREMRAVEIAPGAKVTFSPGGMHIMLVGLSQPLKERQTIPLSFNFEKAGKVDVIASVAKVGAMQDGDMGTMMHDTDHMLKK